ncbi:MAG: hypothetical protein K2N63_10860 [Lachnospiraceae bacterium]|nr:hypothetical protein [Lachnospiraceae bacterium]
MLLGVREIEVFLDGLGMEYRILGSRNVEVDGFTSLDHIEEKKLTWVKNWEDGVQESLNCRSNLIVICKEGVDELNRNHCYFICSDPKMCFFEILGRFYFERNRDRKISEHAVIKTKRIGKGISVGEFSYIGEYVEIGKNVTVGNHVTITGRVKIGCNVVIADGTVLGKSGYGYYLAMDGHRKKVPHFGGLVIGDYVEIGANTCIDCGTMEDTIIGDYTKIDNLCHIGHNAKIGRDVLIVAGSILCGSCVIGDGAYIAPGAVIKNQITVGKNAFVGLQTAATRDVGDEVSIFGVPGQEFKRKYSI